MRYKIKAPFGDGAFSIFKLRKILSGRSFFPYLSTEISTGDVPVNGRGFKIQEGRFFCGVRISVNPKLLEGKI